MKSVLVLCLTFGIVGVFSFPEGAVPEDDPVVVQESQLSEGGVYHYRVETKGGTRVSQDGHLQKVSDKEAGEAIGGLYAFKDNAGKNHEITYTADENGFRPQGDDIPTPPPIPAAIQRALDYIASHPPYNQPEKLSSLKG